MSMFEDEEQARFEKQMDWFDGIARENGIRSSTWSIEVTNMSEVPFPGVTELRYDYSTFFSAGERPGVEKTIHVEISPNSTWLDLWRAADALIKRSGDNHHRFVEDFKLERNALHLWTGS